MIKLYSLLFLGLMLTASCDPQEPDNYEPKEPVSQGRSTKRGVSFNFQFTEDFETLSAGIAWSYNWGTSQSILLDDLVAEKKIDYCPMAWNGINEDVLRQYVSAHPACKYLLGFNEPNLTDQANMTPEQAAQKWPALKAIADELGLKLISPAMNYGTLAGYSNPIDWLDEFFTLVPLDDVEGIAIHCYMPNASSVKSYIDMFRKYNKPIWLTEFCAWDGLNENSYTAEGQQQYMSDILNYLESDPDIFRYAWFIPRGSGSEDKFPYMFLLKSFETGVLTDLGKIFVQMSTQDTGIYYVEQQQIEAEHYSAISISESVNGYWTTGPRLRVTTEAPNETLELYNFLPQQWVDYQVLIDRSKDFRLDLRYATFIDSEVEIEIDGVSEGTFELANTGQDFIWNTASIQLPLEEGRHTLRIRCLKGRICMNWLRLE